MSITIVECGGCGQTFMGEGSRCPGCVAERSALICWACGTQLLRAVPKGLCGLCDEEWVEHLEVAA